MNHLHKVLAWRVCSISITLLVTWLWTGDVKSASTLTIFLHFFLVVSHFIFENTWERVKEKKSQDV
jgi:uncharacterized membrane protein